MMRIKRQQEFVERADQLVLAGVDDPSAPYDLARHDAEIERTSPSRSSTGRNALTAAGSDVSGNHARDPGRWPSSVTSWAFCRHPRTSHGLCPSPLCGPQRAENSRFEPHNGLRSSTRNEWVLSVPSVSSSS